MTDEEIESTIDKLKNEDWDDRSEYEKITFALIDNLVKERNTYRHLLEREMKRHAEFMDV